MKYLVLVLCFLLVGNVWAADEIKVTVTKTSDNSVLAETVISKEEVKAVEYYVLDFADWIIEAAKNKASTRVNVFIADLSDKNVNKLNKAQKKTEVTRVNVKSRKER